MDRDPTFSFRRNLDLFAFVSALHASLLNLLNHQLTLRTILLINRLDQHTLDRPAVRRNECTHLRNHVPIRFHNVEQLPIINLQHTA